MSLKEADSSELEAQNKRRPFVEESAGISKPRPEKALIPREIKAGQRQGQAQGPRRESAPCLGQGSRGLGQCPQVFPALRWPGPGCVHPARETGEGLIGAGLRAPARGRPARTSAASTLASQAV